MAQGAAGRISQGGVCPDRGSHGCARRDRGWDRRCRDDLRGRSDQDILRRPAGRARPTDACLWERTFLSAYDELARALRARLGLTLRDFTHLAECLFENYWATWTQLHPSAERPAEKWFDEVSPHFRGVDCANPNVDFSGALLATTQEHALAIGCDIADCVTIKGVSVERQGDDGIEHIPDIVGYEHLTAAYHAACRQAGVDAVELLLGDRARIEIYTCYPVVPIAFLFVTGLASDHDTAEDFLSRHPVTITGGLNLARAPWNNTTLSTMIQATQMIRGDQAPVIGIHSVAALGYKQAFAILMAPPFA